jgi:HSP20 family molecular chaperone IbpA
MMMMMAGGPSPMFGRRGRRFMMMNAKKEQEKKDTKEEADTVPPTVPFSKPLRRPHCKRGGPRGMCSDLPRESPIEVTRHHEETNKAESKASPAGTQHDSISHDPPRALHAHRRHHPNFAKRMMVLSLVKEQARAMKELDQSNKTKQTDTTDNSVIQVSQQFHMDETDQSLTLSIDVTGFKLEHLELKVENGVLTLQGARTNSLGDIFELSRTKAIDSNLYDEAGIEARCENEDEESCSILRIIIPKKAYIPTETGGAIPIQFVEFDGSNELSVATTATVVEDYEKKVEDDTTEEEEEEEEENILIPEAEIVFENEEEEEERLGQVETVEESTVASAEFVQENASDDSNTTQSWEDLIVDAEEEEE